MSLSNMSGFPLELLSCLKKIRESHPVVQCITNIVTVNDCANVLLAAGASPTMAHHPEEMQEFAALSDALVLNMGATENLDAMLPAGRCASELGHPVVIDPVGCAGSSFRRAHCLSLIREVKPSCIRGNAAEIHALSDNLNTGRGVDDPTFFGEEAEAAAASAAHAMRLSSETGAIVIASGPVDYIADGSHTQTVARGSAWMSRITGSGCMLSSLLGAFLAEEKTAESAKACCLLWALCAEKAEALTKEKKRGTGSFHIALLDVLSLLSDEAVLI